MLILCEDIIKYIMLKLDKLSLINFVCVCNRVNLLFTKEFVCEYSKEWNILKYQDISANNIVEKLNFDHWARLWGLSGSKKLEDCMVINYDGGVDKLYYVSQQHLMKSVEIVKLFNITELSINNSSLFHVPREINKLQNLKSLSLSKNKIKFMSSGLFELKGLKRLYMNCNLIKYIPTNIHKLENLAYLNMSTNKLETLPMEICELKVLEELHIQNNKIQDLPANFHRLENLKHLYFHNNKIHTMSARVFLFVIKLVPSMKKIKTRPESSL